MPKTPYKIRIDGKYMVISHNILERKLEIECFSSPEFALRHASELHQGYDDTCNTVHMLGGIHNTTYNAELQPIRVTLITELDMHSHIEGIVQARLGYRNWYK